MDGRLRSAWCSTEFDVTWLLGTFFGCLLLVDLLRGSVICLCIGALNAFAGPALWQSGAWKATSPLSSAHATAKMIKDAHATAEMIKVASWTKAMWVWIPMGNSHSQDQYICCINRALSQDFRARMFTKQLSTDFYPWGFIGVMFDFVTQLEIPSFTCQEYGQVTNGTWKMWKQEWHWIDTNLNHLRNPL